MNLYTEEQMREACMFWRFQGEAYQKIHGEPNWFEKAFPKWLNEQKHWSTPVQSPGVPFDKLDRWDPDHDTMVREPDGSFVRFSDLETLTHLLQEQKPVVPIPMVFVFEIDEGEGDHEVEFVKKQDYNDIAYLLTHGWREGVWPS